MTASVFGGTSAATKKVCEPDAPDESVKDLPQPVHVAPPQPSPPSSRMTSLYRDVLVSHATDGTRVGSGVGGRVGPPVGADEGDGVGLGVGLALGPAALPDPTDPTVPTDSLCTSTLEGGPPGVAF